jgi:hypothetical protein
MLRWIKNSKSHAKSGFKGIIQLNEGGFRAEVIVNLEDVVYKSKKEKKHRFYLGQYHTLEEAKNARIKFITSLL